MTTQTTTNPVSQATSRHALEVVTTMGDSLIDVACIEPEIHSNAQRTTYVLFAVAAVLLAVSAYAFGHGVNLAARNDAALREFIQLGHRPVYEFRPERMSLVYDWLAFGGLLTGLAALVAAVLRLRTSAPRTRFTVGTGVGVDLSSQHAPAVSFPLVHGGSGQPVVCATEAMRGELRADGGVEPLAALVARGQARPSVAVPGAHDIEVPDKATLLFYLGMTRVAVRRATSGQTRLANILARFERRMAMFLAASAMAHIGIVLLLGLIPPDARSLTLDLGSGESRYTRYQSTASEDPVREIDKDSGQASGDGSGSTGLSGAEGQAGDPASLTSGRQSIKRRTESPRLASSDAIAMAREAGPIGLLRSQQAFTTITTMADFSSGDGLFDMYGNIDGDEFGPGVGSFGGALRGTGPGGGTIHVGEYQTMGPFYPGSWDIHTGPPGGPLARQPKLHGPDPTASKPQVIGDDPEMIRRRIRRQRARIRYCYEKQLLVTPELSGTVVSTFLIDGNGVVIASQASGIGSQAVESCVADVIKSIDFPRPAGGSSVKVTYPFQFRVAG